jgi:hypothetical protein
MQPEGATCHGERGPLIDLGDPYLSEMNFQLPFISAPAVQIRFPVNHIVL